MPQYLISSGLPQLPSSGLRLEESQLVTPLYQGINNLAQRISEVGGQVTFSQEELAQRNQLASLTTRSSTKLYPIADYHLAFGRLVNLYILGGKIRARLADDYAAFPAHGIVNEPYGIQGGNYGEIIFLEGHSTGISGTSFGQTYWLANSGLVVPSTAGLILNQTVGLGLGSAGLYLRIAIVSVS